MKLSFTAAATVFAFSAVASTHPVAPCFNPKGCPGPSKPSASGAVFFITNSPTGNIVVSSHIGPNGKLTPGYTTSAEGRGAHGQSDPIGPDPLFSQGVIKVAGNNVFTVNPGSNTAVMFSIDKNDPAKLTMVGQPVGTGGEFPVSITISKQSGQACVLHSGEDGRLTCFKVDPKLGLIEMPDNSRSLGLNQTTPPTGPAGTVSHIIFNEDGSQLLASVKGTPPTPGFIASWDVDPKSGALSADFTKSTPAAGGLLPFSMTVIPGKDAVLATDAGIGFDIFNYKQSKNASSTIVPITGQKATCWSSHSTKTGNFYLTDVGTGTVTEVSVDSNLNGKVVAQYPQGNRTATIDNDIGTIGNKDFLYVLAAGVKSIMVMLLDAPGQAKPVQQFSFANLQGDININNLQGMAVFVGK